MHWPRPRRTFTTWPAWCHLTCMHDTACSCISLRLPFHSGCHFKNTSIAALLCSRWMLAAFLSRHTVTGWAGGFQSQYDIRSGKVHRQTHMQLACVGSCLYAMRPSAALGGACCWPVGGCAIDSVQDLTTWQTARIDVAWHAWGMQRVGGVWELPRITSLSSKLHMFRTCLAIQPVVHSAALWHAVSIIH